MTNVQKILTKNNTISLKEIFYNRGKNQRIEFRREVCKMCQWSERVFYNKMVGTTEISIPELLVIEKINSKMP